MTPAALASELEQLKAAALGYEARHLPIANFIHPPGVRVAVNFTLDFDAMLARRLANEPPMQLAKGEFGGRIGIWRLLEMYEGQGIKTTVFTPGRICELYRRRSSGRPGPGMKS